MNAWRMALAWLRVWWIDDTEDQQDEDAWTRGAYFVEDGRVTTDG